VASDAEYSFEIGTDTQHTYVSLETTRDYGVGAREAPSYGKLINVENRDGKVSVKGTTILSPKYEFGQTKAYSSAYLTTARRLLWADLVATTNDATFQGMPIGSVLYLGCSGTRRGYDEWQVRHKFAYSKNRDDVEIGTMSGIEVNGWEYLWVVYQEVESETEFVLSSEPIFAYVERMYDAGDFTDLGL